MSHLHEVLAVDKELEAIAWKVFEEGVNTFTKKTEHFLGSDKRYEMFDEGRQKEAEGLREHREVTTTVPDKLFYVTGHFVRFLDALAQKETTNQEARADVLLPDGNVLLADVPATLLLALENKLAKLRALYENLPTLQPGVKWAEDTQMGKYIYKAEGDIVKHKTEKVLQFKIMVNPTDKHPAQVEKWFEDKPIGQSITAHWSGMISPAQKSNLLARIDILLHAVKKARMRANETEVVKINIGERLFNYLHAELK